MTIRIFFTITSIYFLLNGSGALLAPALFLTPVGLETDAVGLFGLQDLGVSYIGHGILLWLARNLASRDALKPILLSLFVTNGLTLLVGLSGTVQGIMNLLGWGFAVINALLTGGFVYFLFIKKTPSIA